ncbi:hypothetical protein HaLaN_10904 [Haematococcus lacustris]|uniref:Uncharacterized protein n=1 Tax=Haematococcus lacustris TaxID=44745 RepID=A0A699YZ04_HAELA|nr:hypothetical protein HaLaN_10904 [Haematococcus lacustris]
MSPRCGIPSKVSTSTSPGPSPGPATRTAVRASHEMEHDATNPPQYLVSPQFSPAHSPVSPSA